MPTLKFSPDASILQAYIQSKGSAGQSVSGYGNNSSGNGSPSGDSGSTGSSTERGGGRRTVVAVIPAAGPSTRMGVLDKLLLPVSGIPLLQRTVSSVLPCVDQVVVVVSLRRAADVKELLVNDALVVVNPRPEDGMGSSIAAGVRNAREADGYLVLPGDMPLVKTDTIALLVKHFEAAPERIAVPYRDGRAGQPPIFPKWAKVDLCTLSGDNGSESIIERNTGRIVQVHVGDSGIWRDIDRPDDYHQLVSSL